MPTETALVVINDHNSAEYVAFLLESLRGQAETRQMEKWLIDDASTDQAEKLAAGAGFKCFRFDRQVGSRAELYNQGLNVTAAEHLIFAHSDIVFAEDFFRRYFALDKPVRDGWINFGQYYADKIYFGSNQIGIDVTKKVIYNRQVFHAASAALALSECTEACFKLRRIPGTRFDQEYLHNCFEHEMLAACQRKMPVSHLPQLKFYHYFTELAAKQATWQRDKKLWLVRNEGLLCESAGPQSEKVGTLEAKVREQQERIGRLEGDILKTDVVVELKVRAEKAENELAACSAVKEELVAFYQSRGGRWLRRYYRLRDWLLPTGSLRRRVLQGVARVVRSFLRLLLAPFVFIVSRLRDPYAPWRRTLAVLFPALADAPYQHWLKQNRYTRGQLDAQRHSDQAAGPLISLVVAPSHAGRNDWQSFLSALQQQTYLKWEACLALAESEEQVVERAAKQDPRIRLIPVERTSDWALQANTAAGAASGGHLALLDPEDMLPPYALYEVAAAIQANPRAEIFYADEDQITRNGRRRFAPHFKPDFSPDTLRSFNYIRRLSAVRRELWERLGGLRPGFGGQCEYDFILRATENAGQIVHIPKILRHRRAPLRLDGEEAGASVSRALQEHLRRMGSNAEIRKGLTAGTYQVVYPVVGDPLVSVIIPTRDHLGELRTCLEGLLTKTDYRRLEILLLENHSTAPEVFRYYDEVRRNHDRVKILEWKAPFNYSAINNWAVRQARGEVLLFMNNDMEVIHGDWLTQLLGQALRPDVGAVGAKLLLADGSIQHAGIVYGTLPDGQGFAGHVCAFADGRQPGNFGRLQTVQNVSAVTGACLMLRKTVFAEAGGFDEAFPIAYGDLDLCLQIRRLGYAIIWTPFAALYHLESRTRGSDSQNSDARRRSLGELQRLKEKWQDTLMRGDPYYNPHLRLEQCDYSVRIT